MEKMNRSSGGTRLQNEEKESELIDDTQGEPEKDKKFDNASLSRPRAIQRLLPPALSATENEICC
jgi:hypothetical protein